MSKEQMEGYALDLENAAKNGTDEVLETTTHELYKNAERERLRGVVPISKHVNDPCLKNFVPVDIFKESYIPRGYRGKDMKKLISIWSQLTVKLVGKQECSSDTEEKKAIKVCTGTVFKVDMHTIGTGDKTVCPCPGHKGDTPSKMVWWKVHVRTTRDFVEPKMDPKMFQFSKAYELKEYDKMVNVTLDCVNISPFKNGGKSCVLEFATHDVELGYLLRELCQQFQEFHRNVYEEYRANTDVNLTIIISYPHLLSEPRVSVGHWVHRAITDGRTWYMYTTPTCPGSAGAMVYRVGQELGDDVHVGVASDGLGFSG
ncbi:uncharacterized protein LOC131943933 [Physella acuta]|uniref:uncharacterized protein LOC131943933 n=1 Tax=Physella acuta TaxID=109671 RepID=UPI0027DAD141|nr:uncharacterized protein LOC131943933 [Physella acuta]